MNGDLGTTEGCSGSESPSYRVDAGIDHTGDNINQYVFAYEYIMKLDIQSDLYGGWNKTELLKQHWERPSVASLVAVRCTKRR